MNDAEARIRELNRHWREAAARRDLDGMMSIYRKDARELLPGMPALEGRAAIRAFYRDLIERLPRFRHRFDPDQTIAAGSGDLAVVRGRYRFTPDSDRPDEAQKGKYVGVWRWDGDDWRLAINISNADEAG